MAGYAGQGNPISVRTNADYPTEIQSDATRLGRYYLFFELAIRYLPDPQGLGRTPADVKGLYLSIRQGVSFTAAFEAHMGLTVASYEAEFWGRMEEYFQRAYRGESGQAENRARSGIDPYVKSV
jgi:hypothetical protein